MRDELEDGMHADDCGSPSVRVDYVDDAEAALRGILGGTIEFTDLINQTSQPERISQVAVQPLAPGLSGAAVFLVRRVGTDRPFTPWVLKASNNLELVIEERENNRRHVQGTLAAAPKLIASSPKLLIFEFASTLAAYNPCTLRAGYGTSDPGSLAILMRHVVESLKTLDRLSEDSMSCVNRMSLLRMLDGRLTELALRLPFDVIERLRDAWRTTLESKDQFPRIRTTAHGDLNSGNVLVERGMGTHPIFIDFASMERSKDNTLYPRGYHLPFWDYAKLERDIQTRLFLQEAIATGVSGADVIDAVAAINGITGSAVQNQSVAVVKMNTTVSALRETIQRESSPSAFEAYRPVLAYAMLTVLFREPPDAGLQPLQCLVAAEASIALLTDPSRVQSVPDKPSAGVTGPTQPVDVRRIPGGERQPLDPLATPGRRTEQTWTQRFAQAFQRWGRSAVVVVLLVAALLTGLIFRRDLMREAQAEPPTWADIEARVKEKYFSIRQLRPSGPFLCTSAPERTIQVWDWDWRAFSTVADGMVCRQDVAVVERGGDGADRPVEAAAVLYTRIKGHWEFWRVMPHPVGAPR